MTMESNEQRSTQSHARSSKRDALIWGFLAAICFTLGVLGFGAGGPWYIFFGSIILAGAAGTFVVRAIRALRDRRRSQYPH